jgi:hypothetical protein
MAHDNGWRWRVPILWHLYSDLKRFHGCISSNDKFPSKWDEFGVTTYLIGRLIITHVCFRPLVGGF